MNTHSAQNYFRTTSHVGVGLNLGGKRFFSSALNHIFVRKLLKMILWVMVPVLGVNLWCSTQISTYEEKIAGTQEVVTIAAAINEKLTKEHEALYAPEAIKLAAAERLLLGPGLVKKM